MQLLESLHCILDLESESIIEVDAQLPSSWRSESLYAFLSDNYHKSDVIIHGYLRQCCGMNKFPLELIKVIIEYYCENNVHLLKRKDGRQWAISLEDIMCLVQPKIHKK